MHKICASMFPHQLKCDFETNTVHGLTILPRTKRNYAVVFVVRVRWEHVSNAVIRNALEHSMELVGWLMEFSMILILEKHSVNSTARAHISRVQSWNVCAVLFNHGVYFGQLVNLGDGDVEVEVYPSAQDVIEIPTTSIINVV